MTERFEIFTIKKSVQGVLADYYITTIYDRINDIMVICAGNSPTDSEANARAYLAVLIARKSILQEKDRDTDFTSRVKEIAH